MWVCNRELKIFTEKANVYIIKVVGFFKATLSYVVLTTNMFPTTLIILSMNVLHVSWFIMWHCYNNLYLCVWMIANQSNLSTVMNDSDGEFSIDPPDEAINRREPTSVVACDISSAAGAYGNVSCCYI
jgi:hypothetical protein